MDHPEAPVGSNAKAKFVVGGSIIALTLVGLIVWAMNRPSATAFYRTTSEIAAAGPAAASGEYRVNGDVVTGTTERDGLRTTFDITDGTTEITVTTSEPLPDAFGDDSEVVASGNYNGEVFTATSVFAKCPSKFEAKV
jgi:cytochrome c-type biogenesis protein CcmE